jgi:nucleotide-binding universal stress UspA family protein
MYQKILVALDHTDSDTALIAHIARLAGHFRSSLILLHVADGWAARHYDKLSLVESEEMKTDRAYLENTAATLRSSGLEVSIELALGDPPMEILKAADRLRCDLIGMTTHGHRMIGDIIHGSTIETVRHRTAIPMLVVRAGTK